MVNHGPDRFAVSFQVQWKAKLKSLLTTVDFFFSPLFSPGIVCGVK